MSTQAPANRILASFPRFGPILLGEGTPPERLGKSLVAAAEFLRESSHTTVLPMFSESLDLSPPELARLSAAVTAIGHIGFLVPPGAPDEALQESARAAGLDVVGRYPSEVLCRELGAFAGRPSVDTRITRLCGYGRNGKRIDIELFEPDASASLVERWIAADIATHVGFRAVSPDAIAEIQETLAACKHLIPPFMHGGPMENRAQRTIVLYYDVGAPSEPDRGKVRVEFFHGPSGADAGRGPLGPPSEEAARLREMVDGFWTSQAVYVVAKLGIADLLADGPRDCTTLASAAGVDATALHRLLRMLASLGIFAEAEPETFTLTPLAACLRSDAPGSMRPWTLSMGELAWQPWGELLHSVRTGESAFARVHGASRYEYLERHPDEAANFADAMSVFSAQAAAAIVADYDFSRFQEVVDVGGGHGGLLATILDANPQATGILLDRPDVAAEAETTLREQGLAARCRCVGGDFFESVHEGADAYILKDVLHNWDDERAAAILRNCRSAMVPTGRILIIDPVIRPGNEPDFAKLLDLHMLVMHGGRERTEEELGVLLRDAGLRLLRTIPTAGGRIVEAGAA